MGRILRINPVARAIGVISAVAILVGGVTFAALQSQVTLTDNTIGSADSNLQIWDGATWAQTAPGFAVDDLIPGEWSDENFVYFKNASEADLDVTAKISEPVAPPEGFGFSGWENLKVKIKAYAPDCLGNTKETDFAALITGNVEMPCNALSEGATGNGGVEATEGNYSLSYKIAPEVVTGTDVNVGEFDYTFTGTVVASEPELTE